MKTYWYPSVHILTVLLSILQSGSVQSITAPGVKMRLHTEQVATGPRRETNNLWHSHLQSIHTSGRYGTACKKQSCTEKFQTIPEVGGSKLLMFLMFGGNKFFLRVQAIKIFYQFFLEMWRENKLPLYPGQPVPWRPCGTEPAGMLVCCRWRRPPSPSAPPAWRSLCHLAAPPQCWSETVTAGREMTGGW